MTQLTIDLTATEFQAMEYAALSVQDWADNAVKNRARIAIDDIVDICVKECLANGIQIPGTKDEIVALAFTNGYVKMTLSTINDTYPLGITDSPYNVLYSSIDTKYYRWSPLFEGAEFGIWSEVIDYVVSKPNIKEKENLAEVQSLYPNGFHNFDDPNEDYVIVQLQATREYYRYDLGWQLYTGMKDAFVIINFLGTLDELETQYPNGYTELINIIAPTSDGKFYEYNGTNGWERVHGYVNRSGWSRFYNQTVVDVTRYNDIPNNKIVDLPEDTYCVAWVYMVHDNSCHLVYGQDFYNFEEAQNASLPTPLPGLS